MALSKRNIAIDQEVHACVRLMAKERGLVLHVYLEKLIVADLKKHGQAVPIKLIEKIS